MFNSIKKKQNPFAFYQFQTPIKVRKPKILVEVEYEAKTNTLDYYRYGKACLDLNTYKIVNKELQVNGKLPYFSDIYYSPDLHYSFAVRVYVDLYNFRDISVNNHIKVTYKEPFIGYPFQGYYFPEPIPEKNIKLGLFIPLDFFGFYLTRKVFFWKDNRKWKIIMTYTE